MISLFHNQETCIVLVIQHREENYNIVWHNRLSFPFPFAVRRELLHVVVLHSSKKLKNKLDNWTEMSLPTLEGVRWEEFGRHLGNVMSFTRLKSDFSFQSLPQPLSLTLAKYARTHFATYTIKEVEMQAKLRIKDNTQDFQGSHAHIHRLVHPLKNIWCSVNRMVLVKSATTSRVRNLGTAHRATLQATPVVQSYRDFAPKGLPLVSWVNLDCDH